MNEELYNDLKDLHRKLRTRKNKVRSKVFSADYGDGVREGERRVLDDAIKALNLLLIKHKQ